MILKRKCCGPVLVPPWELVNDIKKEMMLKRKCCGPAYTLGTAVGIGI